jgi:hypothetical protein
VEQGPEKGISGRRRRRLGRSSLRCDKEGETVKGERDREARRAEAAQEGETVKGERDREARRAEAAQEGTTQ